MANFSAANYKQFTTNSSVINVSPNPTALVGVFISSVTGAATMAIFDDGGTGTSVTMVSAFTPNVSICYYPMPFQARNGLCVSIAATIAYTMAFD